MDIVTLSMAKTFVQKCLVGLGALRGAPAVIEKIEPTYSTVDPTVVIGNTVKFKFEGTPGKAASPDEQQVFEYQTVDILNGRGISKITYDHQDSSWFYYNISFLDGSDDEEMKIPRSVDSTQLIVVDELPDIDEAKEDAIYMLQDPDKVGTYIRYIKVLEQDGTTYVWLSLGNTDVDLSGYQKLIDDNIIKSYKNYDSDTKDVKPTAPSVVGAINTFEKEIGATYDDDNGRITNLKTTARSSVVTAVNELADSVDQNEAMISAVQSFAEQEATDRASADAAIRNTLGTKANQSDLTELQTTVTTQGEKISDVEKEISTEIAKHNVSASAHSDIRQLISDLTEKLNAVADSDDETLDQLSEIVTYIKNNRDLIDNITTAKVNVADIINDLVTNVSGKPLSAAMGVALRELIEGVDAKVPDEMSSDDVEDLFDGISGEAEGSLADVLDKKVDKTDLDEELADRDTQINIVKTSVSDEATARAAADDLLSTAISDEAAARETAVSNEATARSNADTSLSEAIAKEVEDRASADEALQAAIDGKADQDVVSDAWSSTTAYAIGDYCIYDGTLWKALAASTGVQPVDGGGTWGMTTVGDEIAGAAMHELKDSYGYCNWTTMANFPSGWHACDDNLVKVDLRAFQGSIPYCAFAECRNLREAYIGRSTKLLEGAFAHCTALSTISMPNVTHIAANTFQYCTNLTLPDLTNVTVLGAQSLGNVPNIKVLNMPALISSDNGSLAGYFAGMMNELEVFYAPSFNMSCSIGSYFYYGTRNLYIKIGTIGGLGNDSSWGARPKVCDVNKISSSVASGVVVNAGTTLVLRQTDSVPTLPDASYVSGAAQILVPSSMLAAYQAADQWSTLTNLAVIEGTEFEDDAAYWAAKIKEYE